MSRKPTGTLRRGWTTGACATAAAKAAWTALLSGDFPDPVDIALPRDVDPAVRGLSGVFLYDLDDLRSVADANLRERQRDAAAAEALVASEVGGYLSAQRSRRAVPLLVALRERGEEIRRAEIAKARPRLGPLTADQERALDAATTAIVNKLLHTPTVCLKEMARAGQSDQQATLVRRVLGLA